MENSDTNIFQWVVGILYVVGTTIIGWVFVKTNRLKDDLNAHVLHVQETYAKEVDMNVGFIAAAKAAENIATTLNAKMDRTQESVQKIAVEQGRQGENIKNMGDNIKEIALVIKEKH